MLKRQSVLAGAAALAMTVAAAAAGDAQPSMQRTTFLTFSHAVGLPGVTLPAGTYTFELAMPLVDQTAVIVRDAGNGHLRYLGFTHLVARPSHMKGHAGVTIGETRAGTTPPIGVWFPPDDADGRKFLYR
jgi:hypothetical protein